MIYDLIKQRLEEPKRCPAVLQVQTGISAEAAADMLALAADVTALVTPLSDAPRPINASTLRVTRVDVETIAVTMAMVYPAGFEQYVPARDQIITALQGWRPEGLETAIEYAGGQTLQYALNTDGGRWLHQLRFRFSTKTTYEVTQ